MQANIIFPNVTAYNVEKFDVKLNEVFKIELTNLSENIQVEWFSNNDLVLEILADASGDFATVKATSEGKCFIQLQNDRRIVKVLEIMVYNTMASTLNPIAGSPELK